MPTYARRDLLALGATATFLGFPRPKPTQSPNDPSPPSRWSFTDALDYPIQGRGWTTPSRPYSRLPDRAQDLVRPPVWTLAQHTAGLHIDFQTDAKRLRFEVELLHDRLDMPHMPNTGVSGIDLYARDPQGKWRWVSASRPDAVTYAAEVNGLAPGTREYRLYLPLYNGVESLRIGVPPGVDIQALPVPTAEPIVYYGTSIAQGACSSRPGMAFVSQLGRRLDTPVINLGFSGNGRLELELCDLIAELDASLYVIDCLPNLNPAQTAERAPAFFRSLREKQPDTPIVMVEDRTAPYAPFVPNRARHHEENHAALRATYQQLLAEGIEGLTYVADAPFLGGDGEGTVDGSHPSDLGMMRYAGALEPVLRSVLIG